MKGNVVIRVFIGGEHKTSIDSSKFDRLGGDQCFIEFGPDDSRYPTFRLEFEAAEVSEHQPDVLCPDVKKRVDRIQARVDAATPGPFDLCYASETPPEPMNEEQFIAWMRDCLRLGVSERVSLVSAPRIPELHDAPAKESWEREHVTVAITGNGPMSEANAAFITHAREDIPWLLKMLYFATDRARTAEAEVKRLRSTAR